MPAKITACGGIHFTKMLSLRMYMMKITNRTSHFVAVSSILLNSCCFYINPAHSLKCTIRVNHLLREKFDFYSLNNKFYAKESWISTISWGPQVPQLFSVLEKIPLHLQGHFRETLFWIHRHSCTNSWIITISPHSGLIYKAENLYSVDWELSWACIFLPLHKYSYMTLNCGRWIIKISFAPGSFHIKFGLSNSWFDLLWMFN